jgi:uncharacterized protein (TIGR00369 family)
MDYGKIELKLPHHELALQHHGYFHGGVISYLADISGGLAACTLLKDESHSCLTVEMKINFLNPAKSNFIIGKGEVLQ